MNQLQKYTWLIDTIRRVGKISHYWCPLKLTSPIWLFIFLGQPIY